MKYQCPICDGALKFVVGSKLRQKDGITMFCPSDTCPAQEVVGYGRNKEEAYKVIREKYIL
jgi:hypothetical protein